MVVSPQEHAVGTELVGLPQRHPGVDAVLAGFVRSRRGHAPLMGKAADDDGLPLERGVEQDLDSGEEGIEVDMDNTSPVHLDSRFLVYLAGAAEDG